jgi:hypothetical protein
MRKEKLKMNAMMCQSSSAPFAGGVLVISAIAPTERERPKIRSTKVSVLERGRRPAVSCDPDIGFPLRRSLLFGFSPKFQAV